MGRRILVVEDDLLNRMFYIATLEQAGFAVTSVGDGARVIDEVERVRPDLVIMDINLPNVSGLVLTERLKAQADYRDLPILAITAYAGRLEEARIRDAGASGYLSKPVTVLALLTNIKRLLRIN
ncbi:response regulator [Altererythrobacter salegens]|uniref:Response regulator n=1 Tax=Croceibacterium salegens TaxID=1737568 RepID=A0A6I4SY92_9SPHN|nr:response regulator [Croceibacterium salegens]MXO61074.1 response regulator [Croceibacterium salegens]